MKHDASFGDTAIGVWSVVPVIVASAVHDDWNLARVARIAGGALVFDSRAATRAMGTALIVGGAVLWMGPVSPLTRGRDH